MTTTTIFHDLVRRLQSNVEAGLPDMTDAPMKVPAVQLRRPGPLPPGDRPDLPEGAAARRALVRRPRAGRVPGVRAGRAADHRRAGRRRPGPHAPQRLPPPRRPGHRRALRQRPPLHLPVPLVELRHAGHARRACRAATRSARSTSPASSSCRPRSGSAPCSPASIPYGDLDLDSWLGGLEESLAALRLDELHPYRVPTYLDSPNWKLAADGYLDGYHIGYLHRNTIGRKAITNRNTYDLFGPHVRIGFATKRPPRPTTTARRQRQPARLHEPRALRVPERLDLRRARRHADAQQAAARRPPSTGRPPCSSSTTASRSWATWWRSPRRSG